MTIKDVLLREIESLPEDRQVDVLTHVRFLKSGLAKPQTVDARFAAAWMAARRQVAAQGITEKDVNSEVQAVRRGLGQVVA